MELGNAIFGNSRGPVAFPDRSLADSKEWKGLLDALQMDDYGIMGDYYNGRPRTNGLTPTSARGYKYEDKDGRCLFEISPYWWGDCTCGASDRNAKLEKALWKKHGVTLNSRYFLLSMEEKMEDGKVLTDEEKVKYAAVKKRLDEAEKAYEELEVSHEPYCMLVVHNFIYKPGTEEEFWIDWYKYPFRDSYMSRNASVDEIKRIFMECANAVEES